MTKCPKHPEYNGLRLGKVARECAGCVNYYHEMRAAGNKEVRNRKGKVQTPPVAVEPVVVEEPKAEAVAEVPPVIDQL